MKPLHQKIIITLLTILVLIDNVYIYLEHNTVNVLYIASVLILSGISWHALEGQTGKN